MMHKRLEARLAEKKPVRILSLDGGGMRGIIPATILQSFETISGKRIPELFDVVVGTSTGAILSAGLTVQNEQGKAKYQASDFVKLYQDMGNTIFHKDKVLLEVLEGVTRPSYDPKGYEALLLSYFSDATLADALCDVVVPSIELEDMRMHIFSRANATKNASENYYIRDLIRAATAAPSYFPAANLHSLDGANGGTFVDAGVSSNNPGVMALAEAKALVGECRCVFISLGTGTISKPIHALQAKTWGDVEWLGHIFDLQGDAQSSYTEAAITTFLEENKDNIYHRFQIDLQTMPFKLDDTNASHLQELRAAAKDLVAEKSETIHALVQHLTE
ncbi:patatin-like phospholipase family protein [bacterium AH-315-I20]|nr:patatin-like phospholipase family protein [bacterium AH-315-I20]